MPTVGSLFLRACFEPGDSAHPGDTPDNVAVVMIDRFRDSHGPGKLARDFQRWNPAVPLDKIGATKQIIKPLTTIASASFGAYLALLNRDGCDIYYGVNPLQKVPGQDGVPRLARRKENVAEPVKRVHVDMDRDTARGLAVLEADKRGERCPPPSLTVESSPGRYHHTWNVEPLDNLGRARAEGINRLLVARYGGDPAASDCSRILRIPGYANMKRAVPDPENPDHVPPLPEPVMLFRRSEVGEYGSAPPGGGRGGFVELEQFDGLIASFTRGELQRLNFPLFPGEHEGLTKPGGPWGPPAPGGGSLTPVSESSAAPIVVAPVRDAPVPAPAPARPVVFQETALPVVGPIDGSVEAAGGPSAGTRAPRARRFPAAAGRAGDKSASEYDWANVRDALRAGAAPNDVARDLALHRSRPGTKDKHPHYPITTVTKALQSLVRDGCTTLSPEKFTLTALDFGGVPPRGAGLPAGGRTPEASAPARTAASPRADGADAR